MALHKTQAILLKRQELRETSLILVTFTRDLGKIHGVVKGVRGARLPGPGYLEPLTLQAVVLYERKRSSLALISSCDLMEGFLEIRKDLVRTAYALFCLDLVDAMTEIRDPHPELFDLLLNTLVALEDKAQPALMARFLEVHLLQACGLLPDANRLHLSAGGKLSLKQMLEMDWSQLDRLRLSRPVAEELRRASHSLLLRAIGRELKSRTFLAALGLETAASARGKAPLQEMTRAA